MTKKYTVLKDFGDFKAGDVIDETQFDETVLVADLIVNGTFEEVVAPEKTQEEIDAEAKVAADAAAAQAEADAKAAADAAAAAANTGEQVTKSFVFNGKTVISKTVRVVEDKEVHHIKLEDGTEMDLTDEEHDAMIEASKNA